MLARARFALRAVGPNAARSIAGLTGDEHRRQRRREHLATVPAPEDLTPRLELAVPQQDLAVETGQRLDHGGVVVEAHLAYSGERLLQLEFEIGAQRGLDDLAGLAEVDLAQGEHLEFEPDRRRAPH